ncbi:MAG: hypothetical protein MZV64_20655 [Ignavibacteriales bacterium]|nr:hypothetical protein [Ignavibacteriales bacterium]
MPSRVTGKLSASDNHPPPARQEEGGYQGSPGWQPGAWHRAHRWVAKPHVLSLVVNHIDWWSQAGGSLTQERP